jgi:hypothetical protein
MGQKIVPVSRPVKSIRKYAMKLTDTQKIANDRKVNIKGASLEADTWKAP